MLNSPPDASALVPVARPAVAVRSGPDFKFRAINRGGFCVGVTGITHTMGPTSLDAA